MGFLIPKGVFLLAALGQDGNSYGSFFYFFSFGSSSCICLIPSFCTVLSVILYANMRHQKRKKYSTGIQYPTRYLFFFLFPSFRASISCDIDFSSHTTYHILFSFLCRYTYTYFCPQAHSHTHTHTTSFPTILSHLTRTYGTMSCHFLSFRYVSISVSLG
ncbi:hypothetical protein C8Q69DRAFT_202049 [Paecilomyces variotii]|uniref:Uncharacterized protein n=1 Tax=Byssochlamys spectabilis TaxID=264951 RepID=A0A443HXX9_BYSSP|nr:hypothetical protein C8Q69DRAFT_202049 [Paecilomyces variotii]RWQ96702.1 hypothetical protein C8Q69DRAFT_202049 [Paecilomyces variotii]